MIKIRLDDYSPFIKKGNWEKVLEILQPISNKCIIAAIPNHYESTQKIKSSIIYKDFIDGLKDLNKNGFEIAQHGYSHDYPYLNIKKSSLGSRRTTTEFSDVSFEEQERRIKNGMNFFKSLEIDIKGFVSPGHSFDMNTIRICERRNFTWFGDSFKKQEVYLNYFRSMKLICSNYGLDVFAIKKYIQGIKNQLTYQIVIHPNNIPNKELMRLKRLKGFFLREP